MSFMTFQFIILCCMIVFGVIGWFSFRAGRKAALEAEEAAEKAKKNSSV